MTVHYMRTDPRTLDKSYHSVPTKDLVPEDGWIVDEIPTGDFEAHCPREGVIKCDKAAKADRDAGREHIAFAHAMKAVEARLYLAGVEIDGMLRAEADALGVPLEQLARAVDEKARTAIETEVTRRMMKKEHQDGN